jgi:uncharacterized protein with PQ loop repeat
MNYDALMRRRRTPASRRVRSRPSRLCGRTVLEAMLGWMFELIGLAGIVISVLAYLPQVLHLARQHCSAGVSGRAWSMWLASSVMIGALAVHRHDPSSSCCKSARYSRPPRSFFSFIVIAR